MQDCEQQLMAAWISGDNQEHITEFGYFTYYPELFETLHTMKGEINLLTVSKASGIKVAQLAKLTASYIPSIYDNCYRMKKEEKIKAMLLTLTKEPNNITQGIEAIQKEMESLSTIKIKPPTDLCESYRNEIEKRKTVEPLKYGLPTLDFITGGLRRQELTTVSARPGIGKTAFAWQISVNLTLKNHKVMFFPLEMAGFQLMERLVCRETEIEQGKLKTPSLMDKNDDEKLNNFFELYGLTTKEHLNVIEGVRTLTEIKRYIEHYRPEVVIIDQLTQLRENKRFNSLREQFSYMTTTLKTMTMEMDIPIILLAQINRDGDSKEPTLRDLKESGSIEEDSDNVIMLHQTDESSIHTTPVTIIVRKQRNGAKDIRIECAYQNSKYVFREVAK